MLVSTAYVVIEERRLTGRGVNFKIMFYRFFFLEEVVFVSSVMLMCSNLLQWEKNKWKWRIETNMDERK